MLVAWLSCFLKLSFQFWSSFQLANCLYKRVESKVQNSIVTNITSCGMRVWSISCSQVYPRLVNAEPRPGKVVATMWPWDHGHGNYGWIWYGTGNHETRKWFLYPKCRVRGSCAQRSDLRVHSHHFNAVQDGKTCSLIFQGSIFWEPGDSNRWLHRGHESCLCKHGHQRTISQSLFMAEWKQSTWNKIIWDVICYICLLTII